MFARSVLRFMSVAALGGALFISSLPKLQAAPPEIRFKVPFAFVVGGQHLPAGEYLVEEMNGSGTLIIQGRGAGHAAAFHTISNGYLVSNAGPELVFDSVGAQRVLARVLLSGGETRIVPMK